MALNQAVLPEFDREMASTRRTLERVPEETFGWKPHEKSGSMGWLAIHLATLPGWVTKTIDQDSLDFAPPGGLPYQPPALKTRKELLDVFDKAVADGRAAIAKTTDAHP